MCVVVGQTQNQEQFKITLLKVSCMTQNIDIFITTTLNYVCQNIEVRNTL